MRIGGKNEWLMCVTCDGRIHLDGCTTKKNRLKDCCAARHKMLFEQGLVRGIYDDSQHMLAGYFPEYNDK